MTYSVLRLLILAAALGLAWTVGLRGWLLALVAVVVAFAVSYLALPRQRDAATAWMAQRAERRAGRRGSDKVTVDSLAADDAAAEDAAFEGDRVDPSATTER
ncbi:uncharacterized protein DUF4229 [Isoptericola jiangsuensis]|uniref:Uncharacterized protein DUF4229 n=1 Tax=Isoptericola jiangsuensis TaxID=548579 RepID=A0A2A9ESI7_9MICO|nr:uncharacterized protein DUF4229 [Isoptericola jiangsuensis]